VMLQFALQTLNTLPRKNIYRHLNVLHHSKQLSNAHSQFFVFLFKNVSFIYNNVHNDLLRTAISTHISSVFAIYYRLSVAAERGFSQFHKLHTSLTFHIKNSSFHSC
jgi:hypothetical protein